MQVQLAELRGLFKNLQAFQALYETEGLDVITSPTTGIEWSLWDLQYLYGCRIMLSPRQQQAITLCLYENVKESDAALVMGISVNSPVSVYANNGLRRLISMIDQGLLPNFQPTMAEVA